MPWPAGDFDVPGSGRGKAKRLRHVGNSANQKPAALIDFDLRWKLNRLGPTVADQLDSSNTIFILIVRCLSSPLGLGALGERPDGYGELLAGDRKRDARADRILRGWQIDEMAA